MPGTGESSALISYTLHNRGNVTLNPKVALKAEGLFGRDLPSRELTKIPSELLPRQKIRLTERWSGAPQLEWGEVRLTASARDVRESAGATSSRCRGWSRWCWRRPLRGRVCGRDCGVGGRAYSGAHDIRENGRHERSY
ncbi:hypothetical protein QFZ67_005355 [Streptomyces sp. V1I1]|nr:hypothetical protein [Streptomyces sp. V1I1]